MRIIAFNTTFWDSAEDAAAKFSGPFGLHQWWNSTHMLLQPQHVFLACGTWSNPRWNELKRNGVELVNSGVSKDRDYDIYWWQYSGCAYTAAMAYALNRGGWDLLVQLDNDILIGAVDFNAVLREFLDRPESFLSPAWSGSPGGPFMAWKPIGAVQYLHQRRRANLIDRDEDKQGEALLLEHEKREIYRDNWWNPWPQFKTMRQDHGLADNPRIPNSEAMEWPFIRLPHPDIIGEYTKFRSSRVTAVQPDP